MLRGTRVIICADIFITMFKVKDAGFPIQGTFKSGRIIVIYTTDKITPSGQNVKHLYWKIAAFLFVTALLFFHEASHKIGDRAKLASYPLEDEKVCITKRKSNRFNV